MTKFVISKRIDALKKTDVKLFFYNNKRAKLIFKLGKEMQESMEDAIAAEPEFHRCNSEN